MIYSYFLNEPASLWGTPYNSEHERNVTAVRKRLTNSFDLIFRIYVGNDRLSPEPVFKPIPRANPTKHR